MKHCLCAALVLFCTAAHAMAGPLAPAAWKITGPDGEPVEGAADGNLATVAVTHGNELEGLFLLIDLGAPRVVHRLFLTGGDVSAKAPDAAGQAAAGDGGLELGPAEPGPYPQTMNVYVMDDPKPPAPVATFRIPEAAGTRIGFEADLFFQPVAGRYVRIEIKGGGGYSWAIAEVELYGFDDPATALAKRDAVVLDPDAPVPLQVAARDLRYYLGELTGRAVPIVSPREADAYPGTLYALVNLSPLAATFEEMEKNRKEGRLPSGVNVEREGRKVLFKAWPHANVCYSAWEFLRRQGVLWVYPDAHGDRVPAPREINLDILPLRYNPSAAWRYANFGTERYRSDPPSAAWLFWWRNGYDSTWGGHQRGVLGSAEVPLSPHAQIVPEKERKNEHKEGFDGYPHNMASIVPERIIEAHPDWWGLLRDPFWAERIGKDNVGKRLPPAKGPAPCFTSPGLIRFVVDKVLYLTREDPECAASFDLLPMDSCAHCECDRCQKLCEPLRRPSFPFSAYPTHVASEAYYHFVAEVAKGVQERLPNVSVRALAYANVFDPPRTEGRLPKNVIVQVCIYGVSNLPMDCPANAGMKQNLERWAEKCARLQNYDYVLLHGEGDAAKMPTPCVTAIVDRAKLLRRLGALDGGTQADFAALPYNPWNYYAYPRMTWDADLSADQVLDEFFTGYFREAKEPMLAYYRAIEEHLIHNDINLHGGGYAYGPVPGAFPVHLLARMQKHLIDAEGQAKSWVVARRVAAIREGLEWVLSATGLKGVDLKDASAFPRVPPDGGPLVLGPDRIRLRSGFVEAKGDALVFWAQGLIGTHVRFEQPGAYNIVVTARGVPYEGIAPRMTVHVGKQAAGGADVVSEDFREYRLRAEVPEAGVWQVRLTYGNAATGGRRNLYVREIRVAPAEK